MRKQRKLLTAEEKERICQARNGKCIGKEWCPLFVGIDSCIFCYKDIGKLEETIEKIHNEEVEY